MTNQSTHGHIGVATMIALTESGEKFTNCTSIKFTYQNNDTHIANLGEDTLGKFSWK